MNIMADWTAALFPNGQPLVYRSSLNARPFATQWSILATATMEELLRIDSYIEIDPAALGQGGSLIRQRLRLSCTPAFEPVHFESQTGRRSWSADFEKDEIVIYPPDGEEPRRMPREGVEYIFAVTAHQAIAFAILDGRGKLEDSHLTVFLPDPLIAVPYSVAAAPEIQAGRWLRTSHEEELMLDGVVLRECLLPKKGVATTLLEEPPPLPAWISDKSLARPTIVYTLPSRGKFALHDVEIEGPVTPIGAALTIPLGEGPFPAVLFLSGSGTHDRHGIAGEIDVGTHEIMDYLAEYGFVGLRYDTRGAGTTRHGRDALDLGLRALADDAYACFSFLERHSAADSQNLFLVGHSQGGTLALFLTAKYGVQPRGIVLMAAFGRAIDQVMVDQLASQGPLIGLSAEQIEAQRKELQTFINLSRKDGPVELEAIPDHLRGLVRSRSWLREHLLNPPADLLKSAHCPLLITQGDKDFQVSPERDAERLFDCAREAGIDAELARFPTLDHLFKPTKGESRIAQYYDRSRHVSPEFLHRLEAWLSKVKRVR